MQQRHAGRGRGFKEVMQLDSFAPGSRKGLLLLAVIRFPTVSSVPGAQSELEQAPHSRGFSSDLKR